MTSLRTLSRAARRIAASSVAKLVSQQRPKKRYDASESVRRNIEKKVYISLFKDYMDGVGAGTYYKFPEYNKSNDKKKEMYNFNLNIYMEHNYTNYSDTDLELLKPKDILSLQGIYINHILRDKYNNPRNKNVFCDELTEDGKENYKQFIIMQPPSPHSKTHNRDFTCRRGEVFVGKRRNRSRKARKAKQTKNPKRKLRRNKKQTVNR